MTTRLPALLLGLLLVLSAAADDKKDKPDDKAATESVAKLFATADAIFTAELDKVEPQAQTNSIPPTTLGKVTFKDATPHLGKAADGAYSYTHREGSAHMDLSAKGKVLVAAKGKGVIAIVPASETNLAAAKKAAEEKKEK